MQRELSAAERKLGLRPPDGEVGPFETQNKTTRDASTAYYRLIASIITVLLSKRRHVESGCAPHAQTPMAHASGHKRVNIGTQREGPFQFGGRVVSCEKSLALVRRDSCADSLSER